MPETTRQRQAFDAYWRLGAARSIERLRVELGRRRKSAPDVRTLYRWSSRYHWQARIADLERRARVAEDEARIAALREMQERQAREALLLQQKGAQWLAALEEGASPGDAIRAVVEGAKLERLVRGEATDRTEQKSSSAERLESLSDAELDRLIDHVSNAVAGEESARPGRSGRVPDGPPLD